MSSKTQVLSTLCTLCMEFESLRRVLNKFYKHDECTLVTFTLHHQGKTFKLPRVLLVDYRLN